MVKKIRMIITISEDTQNKLKDIADEEHRSMSNMITYLIKTFERKKEKN